MDGEAGGRRLVLLPMRLASAAELFAREVMPAFA